MAQLFLNRPIVMPHTCAPRPVISAAANELVRSPERAPKRLQGGALERYGFIRIHRSVMVNTLLVEEIRPYPTGAYGLRVMGERNIQSPAPTKRTLGCLRTSWWARIPPSANSLEPEFRALGPVSSRGEPRKFRFTLGPTDARNSSSHLPDPPSKDGQPGERKYPLS
jgi:LytTr DNA-binding domain